MFNEKLRSCRAYSNLRYKKIFELIHKIHEEKIDSSESAIEDKGTFTLISLRSKKNAHFPVDIQLGNGQEENKTFLSFPNNINVIYYEDLSVEENDIIQTIEAVLKSHIQKNIVSTADEVLKIIVKCSELCYDNGEPIEFSSKISSAWFWQKTQITRLLYTPWI